MYAIAGDASDFAENICGNERVSDAVHSVDLNIPHVNSSMTLQFTSTIGVEASTCSWGVRDLVIVLKTCDEKSSVCREVLSSFTELIVQDSEGWSNNKQLMNPATTCATASFFGGFNKFGLGTALEKNVKDLAAHTSIKLVFQV